MKTKMFVVLVLTLLITSALPVVGTIVNSDLTVSETQDNYNILIKHSIDSSCNLGNIPDLDCLGSLTWTDVSPNTIVTGSFMVANVGDSGTELSWEIESHPTSWGIWTFVPSSGTGLTPEMGTLTVDVEVVAPSQRNKRYDGEIKVVNSEDSNDFDIIHVYLNTPKNKSFNSNYNPLSWLFDRFPNMFPIIRNLLEM